MKRLFLLLILAAAYPILTAMCGFMVAKVNVSKTEIALINKASQVILARSGDQTVVTMQSDYQGEAKDFALIIPVPEVPRKQDIRIANMTLFNKLNAYSSPRLVDFYDAAPCTRDLHTGHVRTLTEATTTNATDTDDFIQEPNLGVTIEAQYQIGEYDIIILGATESAGLETWLMENDYAIPVGAREALNPYIRDGLKFFVVKVNLEKQAANEAVELSPIQVTFRSDKFMLPIRLGMANAKGSQDMVVYVLTDQGRAEVTNYRTVEMPTNRNVPTFVDQDFKGFYDRAFTTTWEKAGKSVALLEYAWDISGFQPSKCNPCTGTPPTYKDLREAGAFWLQAAGNWNTQYYGDIHFTRLHVRYDRKHFPQDLKFQITPNKQQYQTRYVIQRPNFDDYYCDEGLAYLRSLKIRRKKELKDFTDLTGIISNDNTRAYTKQISTLYTDEVQRKKPRKGVVAPTPVKRNWPFIGGGMLLLISGIILLATKRRAFLTHHIA